MSRQNRGDQRFLPSTTSAPETAVRDSPRVISSLPCSSDCRVSPANSRSMWSSSVSTNEPTLRRSEPASDHWEALAGLRADHLSRARPVPPVTQAVVIRSPEMSGHLRLAAALGGLPAETGRRVLRRLPSPRRSLRKEAMATDATASPREVSGQQRLGPLEQEALHGRTRELAGDACLALVKLDSSYVSHDDRPFAEREKANYDHPSAFDRQLINDHLAALRTAARCPSRSSTTPITCAARRCAWWHRPASWSSRGSWCSTNRRCASDSTSRCTRHRCRPALHLPPCNERGRARPHAREHHPPVPGIRAPQPRAVHRAQPAPRRRHLPQGGLNAPAIDLLLARVREIAVIE